MESLDIDHTDGECLWIPTFQAFGGTAILHLRTLLFSLSFDDCGRDADVAAMANGSAIKSVYGAYLGLRSSAPGGQPSSRTARVRATNGG